MSPPFLCEEAGLALPSSLEGVVKLNSEPLTLGSGCLTTCQGLKVTAPLSSPCS